MNSFEDSKLADVKLDETHLSSTPESISSLPQNANTFLIDKSIPSSQREASEQAFESEHLINDADENYIRIFSSLLLDQINTQDVNAVLGSQQQMYLNFMI